MKTLKSTIATTYTVTLWNRDGGVDETYEFHGDDLKELALMNTLIDSVQGNITNGVGRFNQLTKEVRTRTTWELRA